jgi:hypothetical protein
MTPSLSGVSSATCAARAALAARLRHARRAASTVAGAVAAAALLLAAAPTGLHAEAPAAAQARPPAQGAAGPATPGSGGPGRILGRVVDATEEPISTVTVTLRAASDSAVVTGVVTDPRGAFRLEGLQEGAYFIHVSRLGYASRASETINLSAAAPEVDLGVITLQVAVIQVDGVDVEVDRPPVVIEADRTVYDARQMPAAGTGGVTDVLRQIPELEVDVDDNVRTRGNRAAAIHLNGRPLPIRGDELATFLRQLPGDQVDRIEVMENPSARHDPEGLGGIVNIVLREDVEIGLSGGLNVNLSSRGRQALGGRFNVQRGKLTLFSGLSINRMRMDSESWSLRTNLLADPVSVIEQSSYMDSRSNGWNGNWTAEYLVREGHVLWSNAFLFGSGSGGATDARYGIADRNGPEHDRYDRIGDRDSDMLNLNVAVGYKWIREPRREEISIDLRRTVGENESLLEDERIFHVLAGLPADRPIELTLSEAASGNANLTLQADWFRPVAGDGRLDVGIRSWWRDQDTDQLLRVFDAPGATSPASQRHTGWDYDEFFRSAYATLALNRGALRVQGGLRAEFATTEFHSRVVDERFGQSYRNLFPTANVSYELRTGRLLRGSYARRINRPPPMYLDPFVPSNDPLNVFLGNPELEPAFSQTFTVDLSISGQRGTFRFAPYATLSDGLWERIRTVDGEGVSTSTWENTAKGRQLGTNVVFSLRPVGRLSGSANLGFYHEKRDGTNIRADLSGAAWMWRISSNLGLRVDDATTVQVMASHFPMQAVIQGGRSGSFSMMSLSARRQVMDRRGNIAISVNDPFNMNRFDQSVTDPTFLLETRSTNRSRMISVGFTVNLGQTPQQHSRNVAGPDGGGDPIPVPGGE